LLEWGAENRRDLPWRTTRDPWLVLVSEVMLQQTQAHRVVDHFERFIDRFPTAHDCGAARPADVVRLWSGLGYNRRALNLHRAARRITAAHGGVVPRDYRALLALPGVGASTARAVMSFAFGSDVAIVDTKVVRVLARCVEGTGVSLSRAQSLADRLLPGGESWEYNQTMFDLGATVCTAAQPSCGACPLNRQCRWKRSGLSDPDPWRASPSVRPQSPFAGSDRQGRGRLLHALRLGAVRRDRLAEACGWPDDEGRAAKITDALVAEGFAEWTGGRVPELTLR
jgi:A/G-specific adenine glycosylase